MPIALLATLLALAKKLVDLAKCVVAKEYVKARTQIVAFLAGIAVVFLGAATQWADGLQIGGHALGALNFASKLLLGLMLASGGGIVTDTIKALDNTDSAALPPLAPPD